MKKWMGLVLALLLLPASLAGCGKGGEQGAAPAGQPAAAEGEKGPLHLLQPGTEQGYYHVADSGAFGNYTGGGVILFADYENGREVPLCADPACTHSGDTCPAWVRPWEAGDTLLVEGQTLLGWGNGYEHPYRLTAMDLDGGRRRTLCELDNGESWMYGGVPALWGVPLAVRCAGDGRELYFLVQVGTGGESTVQVRAVPLAGSAQRTVAALDYEDVHLCGALGRELILLVRDVQAQEGDGPWYKGAVVRLLAVDADTGAQREAAAWPLEEFVQGTCGPDAYYDVEKATGHIWRTDLATGARADTGLSGPQGSVQDSAYLEGVCAGRLILSTWVDRGEEQWANPRWAVDLSTGEAAEIGLTVYVEEKMGSRPAPVLAQTEKELYLVEEQRTEHRTLPGLQGAPEDRMFTTQVCCLVPKEDFFASDLRGSRRVLPWGID